MADPTTVTKVSTMSKVGRAAGTVGKVGGALLAVSIIAPMGEDLYNGIKNLFRRKKEAKAEKKSEKQREKEIRKDERLKVLEQVHLAKGGE